MEKNVEAKTQTPEKRTVKKTTTTTNIKRKKPATAKKPIAKKPAAKKPAKKKWSEYTLAEVGAGLKRGLKRTAKGAAKLALPAGLLWFGYKKWFAPNGDEETETIETTETTTEI